MPPVAFCIYSLKTVWMDGYIFDLTSDTLSQHGMV